MAQQQEEESKQQQQKQKQSAGSNEKADVRKQTTATKKTKVLKLDKQTALKVYTSTYVCACTSTFEIQVCSHTCTKMRIMF